METSLYQSLKLDVLAFMALSKDAAHMYVGMVVYLGWVVVFRRPASSLWSLVPVILIAVVMELFDLRDDLAGFGYFRWDASLHDVLNTSFWPAVLVMLFKTGAFPHRGSGR